APSCSAGGTRAATAWGWPSPGTRSTPTRAPSPSKIVPDTAAWCASTCLFPPLRRRIEVQLAQLAPGRQLQRHFVHAGAHVAGVDDEFDAAADAHVPHGNTVPDDGEVAVGDVADERRLEALAGEHREQETHSSRHQRRRFVDVLRKRQPLDDIGVVEAIEA